MKLEIEGMINVVGTAWTGETDLRITYTNPMGEEATLTAFCTKEQAAAFGKHLYQKVRVTIEAVEESTVI